MQHLVKKEQTKWFSLQNKKVKKIKYIRQKTESKRVRLQNTFHTKKKQINENKQTSYSAQQFISKSW